MGQTLTNLIPPPDGFEYFSITFRYGDRIRLIYGTHVEINALRDIILRHWKKGSKKFFFFIMLYCIQL